MVGADVKNIVLSTLFPAKSTPIEFTLVNSQLLTLKLHLNNCDFCSPPLFLVSLFSLQVYRVDPQTAPLQGLHREDFHPRHVEDHRLSNLCVVPC